MASGNLRGIPHLSNVTYFPPKGKEHGLHLRLRVPRLFLSELFHYTFVIAIELEVSLSSYRLPHLVAFRLTYIPQSLNLLKKIRIFVEPIHPPPL